MVHCNCVSVCGTSTSITTLRLFSAVAQDSRVVYIWWWMWKTYTFGGFCNSGWMYTICFVDKTTIGSGHIQPSTIIFLLVPCENVLPAVEIRGSVLNTL